MIYKLFILTSILLISCVISSNQVRAEDIKITKTVSEKRYKLQELKNNFLKSEIKRNPINAFKIENSAMSKSSAMWLGGGVGLVVGGVTGAVVGNTNSSGDSDGISAKESGTYVGAAVGALSGLLIGGVTGYILGK